MSEILRFAILGFGLGALYALAAHGLIVIYRGSGVLNFSHGAMGTLGAYLEWELREQTVLPFAATALISAATVAGLGALVHLMIMRPLRHAAPLARVAATLGLLIVLQAAAVLRYGSAVTFVESELPSGRVEFGDTVVPVDRLILLAIAVGLTAVLWAVYRWTPFGLQTTAGAENERAASALGISPDRTAALNWALGCGLAAFAAILVAPIVTLRATTMTNLVLAATAAALLAGFRSFGVAAVAGILIGVLQSELTLLTEVPGLPESAPFLVIVLILLVRGRGLPLRDHFLSRLPKVGNGRVQVMPLLISTAVAVGVILAVPPRWQDGFITTFGIAIVLLSVVVLTGYAGQLSLGQFAVAGFGAWIAGRLVSDWGWPFWPALIVAVVTAVPVGAIFAIPAVRVRGVNLAIVTLGLGTALELMLFNNAELVGGFVGIRVQTPVLFGLELDAVRFPGRYAVFALASFIVVALCVANLRRGRTGRQLLAVRANERAAASLGIRVAVVKLFAFSLAAGIAALGGIILAFQKNVINYGAEFPNFTSISVVAWAFIGGVGYLIGPLYGATLAPGSVGAMVLNTVASDAYIQLAGGLILTLLVLTNQDGSANEGAKQWHWLRSKAAFLTAKRENPSAGRAATSGPSAAPVSQTLRRGVRESDKSDVSPQAQPTSPTNTRQQSLRVTGLTVRYGGVTAVDDLTVGVEPGRVVGLIGPNGAGKTSAIDAITGFTRAVSGQVRLGQANLSGGSAATRARSGLSRSWQSLELFEDMTVLDNLRTASDSKSWSTWVTDLFWPRNAPLSPHARAAVDAFGMTDLLDRRVSDLSYGQRRLLAIARAAASGPAILLLDEPAAGLGQQASLELAGLVRKLADEWKLGILVVEHDMGFVMTVCDELVVMDFGRTIASGHPADVRANPEVVAAYLGTGDAEPHDDLGRATSQVGERV